jgi:diguanylate cyclase (GGDEF)-like protein/PAS domain S-box-containing protein
VGAAKRRASKPRGAHAALAGVVQRVLRQEAALFRIASLGYQPFETRLREIVRLDATTLDVARVSFWALEPEPEAIRCRTLYQLPLDRHDSGAVLTARDFPRYFDALRSGQPIAADDARQDPRTREFAHDYLPANRIGAMLDVPVFLGGRLHGVVCHEHVGPPRAWTRDEQLFAMSVGQSIALSIEADRRDHTERALRDSERRFRAILEASPVPMVVSAYPDGALLYGNAALTKLTGISVEAPAGRQTPELFANAADREAMLAEIASVGRVLGHEVKLKRADGGEYWAMVSSVRSDIDGKPVLITSVWDVTSKREAEEKLRRAALYDELTGLPNRALLFDLLRAELGRVDRNEAQLAVLYLDLDDFKRVNDRFGHEAGDALLRGVAERIRRGLRKGDVPARVGGDEFVALLPSVSGLDGAKAVAARVADALAEPHTFGRDKVKCPASIGILMVDRRYQDPSAVLRDADAAMYAAKQAGKSRTRVFGREMGV